MSASDKENEEIALRHRRVLKEQVFLLKYRIADGALFLKQRLFSKFDKELQALVAVRLKEEFDSLRRVLGKAEEDLARDTKTWRARIEPTIREELAGLEEYFRNAEKLVVDGEFTLSQEPAYMLESTNVAKLMRKLKEANEQDVQSRIRAVEQAVTFSEHQVYGRAAVERAIKRVYIAPRETASVDDDKSSGFSTEDSDYAPLPEDAWNLLQFAGVYKLAWRKMLDRWEAKHANSDEIDDSDELERLLRTLVIDQLIDNHATPHEFVLRLFDRFPEMQYKKAFMRDVLDCINTAFEGMAKKTETVYEAIKSRAHSSTDDSRFVKKQLVAAAFAAYVEKVVEVAIREMLAQKEKDRSRKSWISGGSQANGKGKSKENGSSRLRGDNDPFL